MPSCWDAASYCSCVPSGLSNNRTNAMGLLSVDSADPNRVGAPDSTLASMPRPLGPPRRLGPGRAPRAAAVGPRGAAVGPRARVVRAIDREPGALELALEPEGHRHAGSVARLVGEEEGDADAGAAGAPGPPDAVGVAVVVRGRVEIDHVGDALDVAA